MGELVKNVKIKSSHSHLIYLDIFLIGLELHKLIFSTIIEL